MKRLLLVGLTLVIAAAGIALFLGGRARHSSREANEKGALFVGKEACRGCHPTEIAAWSGSHHDRAMEVASDSSVLGDFGDGRFQYGSVVSRFYRRDGRFIALTDGPDGALREYEIRYTFGVDPLQQYLVELPGGRLQALSIAWDARPAAQGGQRWFHLYPDERVAHTDVLHWTRRSQNWNHMCSECHSTNVRKNYRADERRYATTWSEIDVSCEACHGPGSRHVAWAERPSWWRALWGARDHGLGIRLDERKGVAWAIDSRTGKPRRSAPRSTDREIQLCARCHSRRSELSERYRFGESLLQTHLPALLSATLYQPDGQIDGEVYEYGSFLQSRMAHAGVTCSDCHNPHSLALRAPAGAVCLQCHAASKYQTPKHHFHKPGSPGSGCVDCHMPTRTYMVVDARHDHSLRIPRPDLSARMGTSNACNDCHRDRSPVWATAKLVEWFGHKPRGYQDFDFALHDARGAAAGAEAELIALLRNRAQPAIARATAASELARWPSSISAGALGEAVEDPDPIVRAGALQGLGGLPPERRWSLARRLLQDPVRVVRIEAVSALAAVPPGLWSAAERGAFDRASAEYVAAQKLNADQPEALVNLGNFYAARGNAPSAESWYRAALRLDPEWVPTYVNLADLLRGLERDAEGERLLRAGLERAPGSAVLHHSLGLLLIRRGDRDAALAFLKRAVDLAPDDPRFTYVLTVALNEAGHTREARALLDSAIRRMPGDPSLNELRTQLSSAAPPRPDDSK